MLGKRAKILSDANIRDLLAFATRTRHPLRNRVIVLLSVKAGLRAGEIASLTWSMVTDSTGETGTVIALEDRVAKKKSGRVIPLHRDLRNALMTLRRTMGGDGGPVIRSERGGPITPASRCELVHDRLSGDWGYRVLVAFGTKNVRDPGSAARRQSRRVVAGRATPRRPSVDPDDPAVHRWRFRRPAAASGIDLTWQPGWPVAVLVREWTMPDPLFARSAGLLVRLHGSMTFGISRSELASSARSPTITPR
jgi:hypothetical protein